MAGEGAQKQLYDAARIGDLTAFQQLLQRNQHFLDVVSFPCLKNVLHIAIKQGKESIVEEVLKIDPELALDVDSNNSSSLHIAAAKRNVEITKRLLSVAPEMCWWRDRHDMNPIHLAAMKGNEEVLKEMLQLDLAPARERAHRGQTALHLCVKHCQIETLKVLVEKMGDLVEAKDDDGETLLHLAVRSNRLEIVRYLVESNKIKRLETDSTGKTALSIVPGDTSRDFEMRRLLSSISSLSAERLPKMTDITMVVVVLIATMAFQAAVSPPGGLWQDGTSSGKAVMATTHPRIYKHFIRATTTAFISSVFTIFLISTGAPQEELFFLAIATYSMWVSITSIGVSYGISLMMTDPMETKSVGQIVAIVVSSFFIVFILLFAYYPIRSLFQRVRKIFKRFFNDHYWL
ncbi:ankyrin repeat-containing protein At5g02620-like [Salvia hispanica]|uniref:ankyrin repeat-containing protein At5g02620-like n=1 Tax=Salvia hispanica TaxID=49212 RepID=UPI0020092314|nr:ankyrin repeat-containing protein At5g02620-like [Salvia hispanica]